MAHRLGEAAHLAGIDEGAGQTFLPQKQERAALAAAGCLHRHKSRAMAAAKQRQLGDALRIVGEAAGRSARLDMRVQPILRNVHSTNDLVHGNLPCACG